MKRQRGRGGGGNNNNNNRRPGHQQNRTFDSNGPEVKVRGPAPHIYEKYLQLARDATSAGDRVMAENFLQHAEHYFRVMRAMQPATPPPQLQDRYGDDVDFDGDEEGGEEAAAAGEGEAPRQEYQQQREPRGEYQQREQRQPYQQREPRGDYQQREPRGEYQQREQRDFQPRPEGQRNEAPRTEPPPREERGEQATAEGVEGGEGDQFRRNNRRRRNRFRPDGERGPRAEGEGREGGEPEGGFGDSVPAFLGND